MLKSIIKTGIVALAGYFLACAISQNFIGTNGLWGDVWEENTWLKLLAFYVLSVHLLIVSMSLSFHRYHTHKGLVINPVLDTIMQLHLWLVGGMSKLDWVSVHVYHHAHSDTDKDPHSPVQKGIWHVLLLGVFDYTKAKGSEPVIKIRKTLKRNKLEQFIADNTLLGPVILTISIIMFFGPFWGTAITLLNWSISPIFAVGGVNGLAHWFGYKNHNYPDNSRNLGFLVPLNFLVAGEMDHNNHHARPKSCSFRHKWYELDWGYLYIRLFEKFKLAVIKNAYTPKTLKQDLSIKVQELMEKDMRFRKRAEELARELGTSYTELKKQIGDYMEGKKVKLSSEVRLLIEEAQRTFYINYRLNLSY